MDLLKKLLDTLHELKYEYKKYLEFAEKQKRALVNNDIAALNVININIEVISVDLQDLEQKRITLMEKLAKEAGVEAISTVSEIRKYFPQSAYLAGLGSVGAELKVIFEAVRTINTINSGLITTSRNYIKTTLAIATSVLNRNKRDTYKTYGASGMVNQPNRQLRSLLNKEI